MFFKIETQVNIWCAGFTNYTLGSFFIKISTAAPNGRLIEINNNFSNQQQNCKIWIKINLKKWNQQKLKLEVKKSVRASLTNKPIRIQK